MAAGQKIKGKDGIIQLVNGATTEEVPCLTSWTLDTSVSLSEDTTTCMLSNGDGGTGTGGDWTTSAIESKSWSLAAEHLWQEDDAAGTTGVVDATDVGKIVQVTLYPNTKAVGKKQYVGEAIVESVSVPSEVNGNVTQSVTYKGNGALTRSTIAA